MFMVILQGPFYKNTIGSVSNGFADLVITRERTENGLKHSKIRKSSSNQNSNKRYSSNINRTKGEINVVAIEGHSQVPYNPYIVVVVPNQYP